jgi:exopolysaccharide biosynthesis WecB/TagA/CpsF family protein
MNVDKITILNANVLSICIDVLLEKLKEGVLITPNLDHLVMLQHDKEFYRIYDKAEWVVCDSKVLASCAKILNFNIEAIPGSSLFPAYCNYHKNNPEVKIFLLGARIGVSEKAMIKINNRIGRKIIVGNYSPSFGFEKNEDECEYIIRLVNNTDATVLVVGVGAPKQEKWIFKYKSRLENVKLFMALGATIDFEAGNIKRAPKIFQKFGFEWLYRLIKEPRRLWRRYLINDMTFFYYFIKQKLGIYRNPFESEKEIILTKKLDDINGTKKIKEKEYAR